MKKSIFVLVLALGISTLFSNKASACSCAGISPVQAKEKAEMVFSATIVGLEYPDVVGQDFNDPRVIVRLRVANVWKGNPGQSVTMNTWQESMGCAGAQWASGGTYLVYAYRIPASEWKNLDRALNVISADKTVLTTSICLRTATLKHATEDLQFLGQGRVP